MSKTDKPAGKDSESRHSRMQQEAESALEAERSRDQAGAGSWQAGRFDALTAAMTALSDARLC